MGIFVNKVVGEIIDFPRAILHIVFYITFLISLYGITKPLAYIVDLLSTENDIKFLED